jgi:hypothetical protein
MIVSIPTFALCRYQYPIFKYMGHSKGLNQSESLIFKDYLFTSKTNFMDKRQINKSRMYFATDLVLDNHNELIATIPELTKIQQLFKDKLKLIEQYRQVQETDSSGLTVNKVNFRKDLIIQLQTFKAALLAFAVATGNNELKSKVSYSESSLTRAADPVLCDIGFLWLNLATPLKTELQRFFINDDNYSSLENLLGRFKSSIPQKRIATGTTKVSTSNIHHTFTEIDLLLKDELDKLMLPFEFSQPDFYNEYKSARSIIGYTGGRKGEHSSEETSK